MDAARRTPAHKPVPEMRWPVSVSSAWRRVRHERNAGAEHDGHDGDLDRVRGIL